MEIEVIILVLQLLSGGMIVQSFYIERVMRVGYENSGCYPSELKTCLAAVGVTFLWEIFLLIEYSTNFKLWRRRR